MECNYSTFIEYFGFFFVIAGLVNLIISSFWICHILCYIRFTQAEKTEYELRAQYIKLIAENTASPLCLFQSSHFIPQFKLDIFLEEK